MAENQFNRFSNQAPSAPPAGPQNGAKGAAGKPVMPLILAVLSIVFSVFALLQSFAMVDVMDNALIVFRLISSWAISAVFTLLFPALVLVLAKKKSAMRILTLAGVVFGVLTLFMMILLVIISPGLGTNGYLATFLGLDSYLYTTLCAWVSFIASFFPGANLLKILWNWADTLVQWGAGTFVVYFLRQILSFLSNLLGFASLLTAVLAASKRTRI